jgi:HD-GYP domain-containing protein (c-di-GMP phosphodiesterase class II)
MRESRGNAGTQFDPEVVDAFLEADCKGLIEDNDSPQEKGEEDAVVDLVGRAPSGEEVHA